VITPLLVLYVLFFHALVVRQVVSPLIVVPRAGSGLKKARSVSWPDVIKGD